VQAFLTLGGSGVIGTAMADILVRRGLRALSVSLSPDSAGAAGRNLRLNLAECSPEAFRVALDTLAEDADLTGILDLVGVKQDLVEILADFASDRVAPVSVISSCLLYDHDGSRTLDENAPVVSHAAARHPYLRAKLAIEAEWQRQSAADWTIFRTHHVLGRGSLLGCLPDHNRDPSLLTTLRQGGPLRLAGRGRFRFSYIHPADFAVAVLDVGGKRALRRQIANLVHPEPIWATDYYDEICTALGIAPVPVEAAEIDHSAFWSLTAKDNVFTTRHDALRQHAFRHDLKDCIDDALSVDPGDYADLGRHMFDRIARG
jgi:nucleoside-diphosphate-sugar epimerase